MKTLFARLIVCACVLCPLFSAATGIWQQASVEQAPQKLQLMHPQSFLVYTMDEATLKLQLWNLSGNPNEAIVISLPMPDGSQRDFRVWQTPMMPESLAARYPDIKTFTAEATSNRDITAKLDFTSFGFHAMVYDGDNTSFIDPYDAYHDGFYMVHYKRDEVRPASEMMKCQVTGRDAGGTTGTPVTLKQTAQPVKKIANSYQLRTYRLALSADNFYCHAAPIATTISAALGKMTTTMNRVNGVYEREVSVTMNFVSNEDTLIWTAATGTVNGPDPFNLIDGDAGSCLPVNQTTCDTRIGTANYDIGHVFTTGAGGLSSLGCACNNFDKAESVTGGPSPVGDGFDIDYVAHEIGHEFGAEHPFNNGNDGSCGGGNRSDETAYEPGSGSTIMAYAGICPPDDLQPHSDAYFHAISLEQIQAYMTTDGDCGVKTPTTNKLVSYPSFYATYHIPILTPFELTAPSVSDSVSDSTTLYCWEEWDRGTVGQRLVNTTTTGPLFRSYVPTTFKNRIFPKPALVLAGVLSDAGSENNEGEKIPAAARTMAFRCTFRDIINNLGAFTFPDDSVKIFAENTASGVGFTVTSQGTTGTTFTGGDLATVTWDVDGTDAAPVSADSVDIYLSLNCGSNYFIGTYPNNGSAAITVPNPDVDAAGPLFRFKVKGHNNVFFNVNGKNFTINNNPSLSGLPNAVQGVTADDNIKVYPVPADNVLNIVTATLQNAIVVNTTGQKVWEGTVNGKTQLPVAAWAKGVYYIRFADAATGRQAIRSLVIE